MQINANTKGMLFYPVFICNSFGINPDTDLQNEYSIKHRLNTGILFYRAFNHVLICLSS
jgi:hypothetical protein